MKAISSAWKMMAILEMCGAHRLFRKKHNISGESICAAYMQIQPSYIQHYWIMIVKEKCPQLTKEELLFHHKNTSSITLKASWIALQVTATCTITQWFEHPVTFIFLNLKKFFIGKKFTSNMEIIVETNIYFTEQEKLCYYSI